MRLSRYRVKLSGGAMERVTKEPGTHAFDLSPDAHYAVDIHSTINGVPTATLYALPSMRVIRPWPLARLKTIAAL